MTPEEARELAETKVQLATTRLLLHEITKSYERDQKAAMQQARTLWFTALSLLACLIVSLVTTAIR